MGVLFMFKKKPKIKVVATIQGTELKDTVDNIEQMFRNLTRDSIVVTNIHGLGEVDKLRTLLKIGKYEDPFEKKRARVLKSLKQPLP